MDVGLIPLYIYITMTARANYQMVPGSASRWTSQFDSDNATAQLINAIAVAAEVNGALHVFSVGLDFFLVIMFKRINDLPPEFNPLEEKKDNLTRRKTKHKYKNSEITLVDEKHLSDFSVSSIPTPNRMSRASENDRESQNLSFMQSRNGADGAFSPHSPKTADMVRANMYKQYGAATSQVNLNSGSPFRHDASEYSQRTSPMPGIPMSSKRNSGSSAVSSLHSFETTSSTTGISSLNNEDNWFAISDEDNENADAQQSPYAPQPRRSHLQEITNMMSPSQRAAYEQLNASRNDPSHHQHPQMTNSKPSNPLRMNPPTPPPQPIAPRVATQPLSPHLSTHTALPMPFSSSASTASDDRSRTMLSGISSSSLYSADEPTSIAYGTAARSVGAPKSRFYGDLTSAMRGVRENPAREPRPQSMVGSVHHVDERRAELLSVSGTVVRRSNGEEGDGQDVKRASYNGYGRVVSRSGADVMGASGDLGVRGRRDVSGKIAEEGRGGVRRSASGRWFGSGLLRRSSRMD
jgi:hypothetical protein